MPDQQSQMHTERSIAPDVATFYLECRADRQFAATSQPVYSRVINLNTLAVGHDPTAILRTPFS